MTLAIAITIIKKRYRKGDGLNIASVEREIPTLIEFAFNYLWHDGKPIGWRLLLRQAEINPFNIVHELEDNIQCQICGEEFTSLQGHLKHKHQMSGPEYKEEFGVENLFSETYRARVSNFDSKTGWNRHWEKYLSKRYAVDLILTQWRINGEINSSSMRCNNGRIQASMETLFGEFGWDKVLLAAGFDPNKVKLHPYSKWTDERLKKELTKHVAKGGKMPTAVNLAARKRYGTVADALLALKIGRNSKNLKYSTAEISACRDDAKSFVSQGLMGRERVRAFKKFQEQHIDIIRNKFKSLKVMADFFSLDPGHFNWQRCATPADTYYELTKYEGVNLYKDDRTLWRACKKFGIEFSHKKRNNHE